MGIEIISTGSYVPSYCMTNEMMERIVDTSHEWIITRTGIASRYFAKDEDTTDLACKAAINAIENGNINKEQIKMVVVATFTPDYLTPSVAAMIQKNLNLSEETFVLDINAACSGFVYGLEVCDAMMQSRQGGYALLVGSEVISKVLDFEDRTTCVLFGDGAGAVVLRSDPKRLTEHYSGIRGNNEDLFCPGVNVSGAKSYVKMKGKAVFRFAVEAVTKSINTLLERTGLEKKDIAYYICHQANERIIAHVQKEMDEEESKFYRNLERYGNTSAASIPIVLHEMNEKNLLKKGMKIILVGFGGGLTWGGSLIEW